MSRGPRTVAVPDLGGMSAAAAQAALQALGLTADESDLFGVPGHVVAQSPSPGKQVKVGSSVRFYTA